MEITIIGWYGTETIGDRAILAGILNVLSRVIKSPFSIRLGSLYPFYSERTVSEDKDFYHKISCGLLQDLVIFDSRNPSQLRRHIKSSDLLMVGGGPLLDIGEMAMLEYAFTYAHAKRVKSVLCGCGWGPLTKESIRKKAQRLVELSDVVIFRDEVSRSQCLYYCPHAERKLVASIDPASFSCHYYISHRSQERSQDYVAINLRDVAVEGNIFIKDGVNEDIFVRIVNDIISHFNLPVRFIPMHNFFIGGDDRAVLERIARQTHSTMVSVIHRPLSLEETMDQFYHANLCVGMRFHSILLQTLLNGNNYIIDYTHPETGKIIGMMAQLDMKTFYKSRYFSLHTKEAPFCLDNGSVNRYQYSAKYIEEQFEVYSKLLSSVLE